MKTRKNNQELQNNARAYSGNNPPPYPVTSVAGKTGKVSLSKSDVGLSSVADERQYSESNPMPLYINKLIVGSNNVYRWYEDLGVRTRNGGSSSVSIIYSVQGDSTELEFLSHKKFSGGMNPATCYNGNVFVHRGNPNFIPSWLSDAGYEVRITEDSRGYKESGKWLRTFNLGSNSHSGRLGYLSGDGISSWGRANVAAFLPVGMAADLDNERALLIKYQSITKGPIPSGNYPDSSVILGTFTFYRRYVLREEVEQNWLRNQLPVSDRDVGTYFTNEELY